MKSIQLTGAPLYETCASHMNDNSDMDALHTFKKITFNTMLLSKFGSFT